MATAVKRRIPDLGSKAMDTPNAVQVCYVTWQDVPLSCPTPRMPLWNSHPRIYLPIQESGLEQCPYCGTVYILVDEHIETTPPDADRIDVEDAYHTLVTRQHDPGNAG